MNDKISVIIPARNEVEGLRSILPVLCAEKTWHEIIVVDDGSTDATHELCGSWPVTVISHKYAMGNGAAIKTGVRAASGDVLVLMDADGQHDPREIGKLLAAIEEGYDMAVGARDRQAHAGKLRWLGNQFYNHFASWVTGPRWLI